MMDILPQDPLMALPALLLTVLFWALVGRMTLAGLVPKGWDNPLWQGLVLVTQPFVQAAGWLSPQAIPERLYPLLAAGWIFFARVLLALFLLGGDYGDGRGILQPAPLPFERNMPLPGPINSPPADSSPEVSP